MPGPAAGIDQALIPLGRPLAVQSAYSSQGPKAHVGSHKRLVVDHVGTDVKKFVMLDL